MSDPLTAVVRVAATPSQAKVFAALLQAEGIPAIVEGDSLADEVAISRRVMNLGGTRVLVPSASLARATEILAIAKVDDAELEAQALAATSPERPPPPRAPVTSSSRWPLFVASGAAIVFLGLWLSEVDARAASRDPLLEMQPTDDGVLAVRRRDGSKVYQVRDVDRDAHYEHLRTFARDGQYIDAEDADRDQLWEKVVEHRTDGTTVTWTDRDRDGLLDQVIVTGADGSTLQTLRWVAGKGFEITK